MGFKFITLFFNQKYIKPFSFIFILLKKCSNFLLRLCLGSPKEILFFLFVQIQNPCNYSPCSQICLLNSNNSYTCACTLDTELAADNHNCRGITLKSTGFFFPSIFLLFIYFFVLFEHLGSI